MGSKRFTREQLYERVWQTPMAQLAKSFGLSDVGLAKLCRKHDIPIPPRGYWAKIQAGHAVAKAELPSVDAEVVIRLNELSAKEVETLEEAARRESAKPSIAITVADTLRGAHPLVSAAREELSEAKVNGSGIVSLPEKCSLNLSVSRAQSHRALRIIDAVLKYAVSEGHEVSAGPVIKLFGESVPFGIKEAVNTVQVQPDTPDLKDKYEFLHSRFDTRYEPSGKVTIFLEVNQYHTSGCRRQWKDTDNRLVEAYLGKFFEGVIRAATMLREHSEEMRRRQAAAVEAERQHAIQAKHWADVRQKQAHEQSRLDDLLKQVSSWRLSNEIRAFVDAFRSSKLQEASDQAQIERVEQWSQWALMHADRFDPTKPSPPSILDERIPEEPRRW